jgi:hypothetical protein
MPTPEQLEELARAGRPITEFPDSRFPTAFADGVASLTPGNGLAKFFLYRTDPNSFGRGGIVNTPFLQIAMPIFGFVQMALFFQRQLQRMIDQKAIEPSLIAQISAELDAVEKAAAAQSANKAAPDKSA